MGRGLGISVHVGEIQDKWVRRKPGHSFSGTISVAHCHRGTVHQLREQDWGAPEHCSCMLCPLFCIVTHSFLKIVLYTGENWMQPWEILIRNGLKIVLCILSGVGARMGKGREGGTNGCLIPSMSFLKAHFGRVDQDLKSPSENDRLGSPCLFTVTVIFQLWSLNQHWQQQLTQKLWASVFFLALRVGLVHTEV